MDPRLQPGLFGTGASLLADLTLLGYLLLIVPGMLAGFVFARRKLFEPHHKLVMTGITLFNWLVILFLMAVSYGRGVAPEIPQGLGRLPLLMPSIHLIFGLIAQLLATYLVLRMWFEDRLPPRVVLKRFKGAMRLTLSLWLVTALLGAATYVTWYILPDGTAAAAPEQHIEATATPESEPQPEAPVTTPEVTEEAAPRDEPQAPETTEEPSS